MTGSRRRGESTLPRPVVTVWLSWTVVMAGVNLAAPLYAVYARSFDFSSLVLTLVFATYAVTLIPSLLVFGSLSDRVGRRPLLLGGLVAALVGLLLFDGARSAGWLFGARAVQGVAVGMISGPATAALVELDPRRAEKRPAMFAGLAQAGGCLAGPLLAGILAEWAVAPTHLCYLVVGALTLAAGAAILTVPDPVPDRPHSAAGRWRIQRPRVPTEIRTDFARVSLTAALAWGTAALYLSVVPSYAAALLDTSNLALLGALIAVALTFSCLAQVATQRWRLPVRRAQVVGLGALVAGSVLLAVAAPTSSLVLLLLAAIAAGTGHGLAFLNAQDELNSLAPPDRRGEVTAAFICCIYAVVAVAVIGAGLLALTHSLPTSVATVSVLLAVGAAAACWWQARPRL